MFTKLIVFIFFCFVSYAVHFAIGGFPVLTGFSSKIICSNHFIAGRDSQEVLKEDVLSPFATLVVIRGIPSIPHRYSLVEGADYVTACIRIFGKDVRSLLDKLRPYTDSLHAKLPIIRQGLAVREVESLPLTPLW